MTSTGAPPTSEVASPLPAPRARSSRRWTLSGRLFAGGIVIAGLGLATGIANALPPRWPLILFCLGAGVALTALGVQVLLNQIAIRRSRTAAVLSLLFIPHLLIVPAVGIGLIVTAIGMLIGYPGF